MYYNKLHKITKAGRIGLATGLGGMLTSITLDPLQAEVSERCGQLPAQLEVNKGSALLRLKEAYQLNGLIFLGDDLTDLEGFRTLRLLEEQSRRESTPAFSTPFYSLAVGVSTLEMPPALALAAHLLVDGVNGVEKFLASLFAAIL